MTGKFIVFEGIDGSGKTTQIALLKEYLQQKGHRVISTREPGGTPVSEEVRAILLNPEHKDLHYRTEALLYAAARAQHVETLIKPALEQGAVVLCDRFVDSTLAYQGYGRGLSLDFLQQINNLATGGLQPHLVLIFDLTEKEGLSRVKRRSGGDRLEREPEQFHRLVRQGYLEISRRQPKNHLVLNASLPVEELQHRVRSAVEEILNAAT
ncbi:dTMP kinase [Desulfohalotomaculum tongense]|uniref:dTMP kinase n=1 Tax=Desulforadius tongensis TaxID=1216062 RepID=UPI00195EE25C|nr:dTMP kinase [Desulforadius tongensis]MBM7855169.1 dTMP kinase [Desulforadius tongensis]